MIRTRNSILIKRGVEDVYNYIALNFFDNYQKWSPQVSELEQLGGDGMQVGATGRQVRCDHGYHSEAYFRVTRMTPLRELRFASSSRPFFEICYLFEPAADGTRLTFEFRLKLPVLMLPLQGLARKLIDQDSRRVVVKLQALLETETGKAAAHAPPVDG